ncbi:MAG: CoA-transferase [Smithella sp.]|jgi:propionate CoA-transferase
MKQLLAFLKLCCIIIVHRIKHGKSDVNPVVAMIQLLKYRATWRKHDSDYVPGGNLPKVFMSARKAVQLIPDGATVISTGIAGNSRCSIYYWAVREMFERTGRPSGLTWMVVAAAGGRGEAPGTLEEVALPGLLKCHISGHVETHKALLKLGDEGKLDVHTMPQGVMTRLIEGQAKGIHEVASSVGVGTFLDPRVGTGTSLLRNKDNSFVRANDDTLVYTLPEINVAIFSAPYADREGNIYFRNAATITENVEAAHAARANGGVVLVTVSDIIEPSPKEISVPAAMVDAIVVNPRNEQTGGVIQRKYFPMFTEGAHVDIINATYLVKLANTFTGITPIRDKVDNAVARMAASLFVRETTPGSLINFGVGLPEEVSNILFESGLYKQLTFTTESGVYGGMPASGMYFGASINPLKLISSARMFHLYEKYLDVAVLGCLEVDSDGNNNVSRRGDLVFNCVGPGGFPDIVDAARTIIFVGKWTEKGKYSIEDGKLVVEKHGKPKFVARIREITFNAQKALAKGAAVYYVNTVGIFKLTTAGVELISVMPGVDVEKDIIKVSGAKINIPKEVPIISDDLVTGKGFSLKFERTEDTARMAQRAKEREAELFQR